MTETRQTFCHFVLTDYGTLLNSTSSFHGGKLKLSRLARWLLGIRIFAANMYLYVEDQELSGKLRGWNFQGLSG